MPGHELTNWLTDWLPLSLSPRVMISLQYKSQHILFILWRYVDETEQIFDQQINERMDKVSAPIVSTQVKSTTMDKYNTHKTVKQEVGLS